MLCVFHTLTRLACWAWRRIHSSHYRFWILAHMHARIVPHPDDETYCFFDQWIHAERVRACSARCVGLCVFSHMHRHDVGNCLGCMHTSIHDMHVRLFSFWFCFDPFAHEYIDAHIQGLHTCTRAYTTSYPDFRACRHTKHSVACLQRLLCFTRAHIVRFTYMHAWIHNALVYV